MNLVDAIQGQLTKQVTGKLASLIGGNEAQTQSAIGAAVPGLLSAISGVALSGGSGASQLTKAVGGFDMGTVGKLAGTLLTDPDSVQKQGGGFLGSIISGTVLSGLAGAIAKFSGLDARLVKKLLGYLSPLVIGMIAHQFKGKQVTAQGLSSLFTDQKKNIGGALPDGFSLDNIPGLSGVESVARKTTSTVQQSSPSLLKTLLPFIVLAALALFAWYAWQNFSPNRDVVVDPQENSRLDDTKPSVSQLQAPTDLRSSYAAATDALKNITDAASAEAALPKLNELNEKLNGLVALWDKLPKTVQTTLSGITRDNLSGLEAAIKPVLEIPGVGKTLAPVLKQIIEKLTSLGGAA